MWNEAEFKLREQLAEIIELMEEHPRVCWTADHILDAIKRSGWKLVPPEEISEEENVNSS